MLKSVLSLALIFLCQQVLAQERFIVYLSEYVRGNINSAVVRCPATIITNRHVLTTAACAIPTNSSLQLAIEIRMIFDGLGSGSRTISADRAFIHPNYTGDVHSNNVAVVLMGGEFNIDVLPPRTLGSIPASNTACNLFGWGGAADYPENVSVVPHGPAFCYTNRLQTYCSEHLPQTRACSALVGSPLICNPQSVDGILLETGCLEESPGRFLQAYHSVSEFKDWIEMVSSAKMINLSLRVILLSFLVICLKNVV